MTVQPHITPPCGGARGPPSYACVCNTVPVASETSDEETGSARSRFSMHALSILHLRVVCGSPSNPVRPCERGAPAPVPVSAVHGSHRPVATNAPMAWHRVYRPDKTIMVTSLAHCATPCHHQWYVAARRSSAVVPRQVIRSLGIT